MENQNVNTNVEQQEVREPQGWKDVTINADMPLAALVHFFNILNQRLCTIEDNVQVEMPTGEKVSITEVYHMQALMEQAKQEQVQAENKEGQEA